MTASVVSLSDFAARVPRRPKSESQIACDEVRRRLAGVCQPVRIAQACARVERLVVANYPPRKAIERVVAWATCADDPEPPKAA